MPRADFDLQLDLLQKEVEVLATTVAKSINLAVDALKERDLANSDQVVRDDDYIDQKRFEIEERCIDLIASQQPMARDLRVILALLHIAVELERMGDYAEGIAKISLAMGEDPPVKPLVDIPVMAEKATAMLHDSMDALFTRDVVKAQQVCQADDNVDELYDQVYRNLLLLMIKDPETIKRATYLLWVAHDLERIADRATNIAERVIFLVTGKLVETKASNY
ncbi:MAG: phosphate signaling complex protein PhoU [Dehalococcoidia bacterium]|jgi:phosphate transport system protein|nr:phosphate signaling complex protein PhoU [Dehalococcoidia bacterium]MDP7083804.1 phosphate signaling complex protein PhoU [Dehalococcoidia bacterium]HJN87811.1 phosphate signaling complex protein PhoU [Dehalococcoidia bacterium]